MLRDTYSKLKDALKKKIERTTPKGVEYHDKTTSYTISILVQEYRKKQCKRAISGPSAKIARIGLERYARKRAKILAQLLKRRNKRVPLPLPIMLSRYHDSAILSGFDQTRRTTWIPLHKRERNVPSKNLSLSKFSILDHPVETLRSIKMIGHIEARCFDAQLNFDDDHCVDISAYLILAEIWPDMAKVFHGGRMSFPIQKVISAVGLDRPLRMAFDRQGDGKDIWAFRLKRRRASGTSQSANRELDPQSREKVADNFCDALDEWIGSVDSGLELTILGRSRLASLIGEILDNAERHSAPETKDGSWSIAGFMARRIENDREIYRCHLGFLSVGSSIAESLATCAPNIREEIDRYTLRHVRAGQSTDTLATLVALQDGITRDRTASLANRGGVGLQDVIEFANALGGGSEGNNKPKITIVSGRSCIMVRDPYIIGQRNSPSDQQEPRVLWFNSANSPQQPPDPNFVFDIEDHFSGTVIGLSFVLDGDYLRKNADDE